MQAQWDRAVDAFLAEIHALSGSDDTVRSYGLTLRRFFSDREDPSQVIALDVHAFAYAPTWRGNRPPSAATVHSRLNALKAFYARACEWGLATDNPAARVRRPKLQPSQPRGLDVSQLRQLLGAIPRVLLGTRLSLDREARDTAMIITMIFTALRVHEATSLTAGCLQESYRSDAGGAFALIRRKGGKRGRIYLPPPVLGHIRRWLERSGKKIETMAPGESLWNGTSDSAITRAVRAYGRFAGLGHVTPHTLRHSAAKLRRACGDEPEAVQALLSHESLATTSIYLKRLEPPTDESWRAVAEALGLAG